MVSSNELLSGASAYAGIVGILFSVWYAELSRALKEARPTDSRNAGAFRENMRDALFAKVVPLVIFRRVRVRND
jgi:hypothetical protein